MKRIVHLGIAATILLATSCDATPLQNNNVAAQAIIANDSTIVFADGTLTILGTKHRFPFLVANLNETLGPPDRVTRLENCVSTWDKFGIVAYERNPGDPINAISISFGHRDYDFSPKTPFSGMVEYRGFGLSRNSTRRDLIQAGLIQDELLPFLHVADDGEFKIIAEFDDGLVDFSINH